MISLLHNFLILNLYIQLIFLSPFDDNSNCTALIPITSVLFVLILSNFSVHFICNENNLTPVLLVFCFIYPDKYREEI